MNIKWIAGLALVVAGCGGSGDSGTAAPTSTPPPTTTTSTSAAATTSTTTTTPSTTTSVVSDPIDDEAELARSLLLTLDDFVEGWTATDLEDDDNDFDYSQLEGCELIDALQADESHTVEEGSPTFSIGEAEFEQEVRLYPAAEDAGAFLDAWADDSILACTRQAFQQLSAEAVEAGAFGEVDSFETGIDGGMDEFDGFRLVSYQAILTVTTGTEVTDVYVTNWIMQRDRAAARLDFVNVGEDFGGQEDFILAIAQRFEAAGF